MLSESKRVLKDDGLACFSVWGRPDNSFAFTLIPNVLKKNHVVLPDVRSYFHTGKIEKLGPMIQQSGFKRYSYCYSFLPFDILGDEDFLYLLNSPIYQDIFAKMDKAQKDKIYEDVKKELADYLNTGNILGIESLIVLCRKQ